MGETRLVSVLNPPVVEREVIFLFLVRGMASVFPPCEEEEGNAPCKRASGLLRFRPSLLSDSTSELLAERSLREGGL